ncbi:MAG TPA: glycosyltransferase family 2 protein, partial [Caldithrix sp.]|nr:glycosyltransferase family 2 protein [Caldithrix sp.]
MTKITIVIPHYNGIDILRDCLQSLFKNTFTDFITLVIDNGSSDGSQEFVKQEFPQVKLIENEINLGYAGGCNQGIQMSDSPYILLLNNDTVMPENFLSEMIKVIENDDTIAMVQPKILSIQNRNHFDYSGGAGGELDIFGYPFARGRIFDEVEQDQGQYNAIDENCFWTSGCALLLRKSVTDEIGVLDEDFFAHQEEIDLNWRAQLAGYRNVVTTHTFIYHYSGYTLRSDNERKMFLNHRNNLIMMIKNYSLSHLILLFPIRIILELLTIVVDFIFWEGKRSRAALKSLIDLSQNICTVLSKRKKIQKLRK